MPIFAIRQEVGLRVRTVMPSVVEHRVLRSQVSNLTAEIDLWEEEVEQITARLGEAQARLDDAEAALRQGAPDRTRATMKAVRMASTCWGGRIAFLPSALHSASGSRFQDGDLVFAVLSVLALTHGGTTGAVADALRMSVGKQARWRPKDSDATTSRYGGDRDFAVRAGDRVRFSSHITLGHGERAIQVYYRVAPDGIVEVGHIGQHLRTVSHDG